ncbi:MAG: 2-oxoacid:acceptor oxidoreductase subunit alpha [Candidatus Mcinerneyibacterium aminivorans]|uniref:2-oxoacid:acceptor oxidoreductase subunit alpha n=1 Tax=Candidatus Mcinerneyibacterium aminivorans TaxID=2703815 RepID=A0A5D0MGW6_9BACT|nr:MAG: 2-oxoacid:acceptor oxidoreductase subunit alpha [Candidatus Mcinerneyibacterium aminivorans]
MNMANDFSIVLAGAAGQGIQVVENLAVNIFKKSGFNVFAVKKYMSRVRGGNNSTEIRISDEKVRAYLDRIDIFIPFSKKALFAAKTRISEKTLIILDEKIVKEIGKFNDGENIIKLPISESAEDIKEKILINTISTGILSAILGLDKKTGKKEIEKYFEKKGEKIVAINLKAFNAGYELIDGFHEKTFKRFRINRNEKRDKEILINGSEAITYGGLAAGCNFVSAYPMSPSTDVLQIFSKNAKEFGVVVEQIEDEISAVNMSIGAWYAGARAMVTTSGGGFALMSEGLSLSGMIESPLVIHNSQRPAPATGLPTRTAQEDLNLVIHSGHGEFPRIVFAPGTLEEGFYLSQIAFNYADKFQVPVIILTDQYYVSSYYNFSIPDLNKIDNEKSFIKTEKNYKRHKLTENGISPRGIPGFGEGLVRTTGNEHLENGMITEEKEIRNKMQDKRNRKRQTILENFIEPNFVGLEDYNNLIVCWGSTFLIIKEAVQNMNQKDTSILHFKQVYPLSDSVKKYFDKANKTIVVENNSTGQFKRLLKAELNINCDESILKYDGRSFSVENLTKKLQKRI